MNVLLTGANGYIGKRLLPLLVLEGHTVFCLVREKKRHEVDYQSKDQVIIIEADLLDAHSLQAIPKSIDVAFYLVHSMGSSSANFHELESLAATNFVQALNSTNAKQIIYLSGIANDANLSKHLNSRKKTEEILLSGNIPVTVLRAAIIIGSGGASFEITRDLVEKLPVMIAPKWINTKCQPIAIRNVLQYLMSVILLEATYNKVYDIGGPDVLSYRQMLMQLAEVRKLRRWIISLPFLTPRLSSLWLFFVTSTTFSLARSLVDSMKNEVIVKLHGIDEEVEIEKIPYKRALELSFDKIAQDSVLSSWKDAVITSNKNSRLLDRIKVPIHGCFSDKRKKYFDASKSTEVINRVWNIGGKTGWYYGGLLWKLRGFLDKLVGGVGLRRGRRSPTELEAGDALDFWRVLVADKQGEEPRLLLYAEMKLPGEAWLEFKISNANDHQKVYRQTATFRPQGLYGRLYWYMVLPFHAFIFEGMANNIILEQR